MDQMLELVLQEFLQEEVAEVLVLVQEEEDLLAEQEEQVVEEMVMIGYVEQQKLGFQELQIQVVGVELVQDQLLEVVDQVDQE
jgi:hypothetical protein